MVTFSKEDILRSKIVKPEWYESVIKDVVTEQNKNKDADNYVTTFVIQGGEFDGVPITVWFSEKAPGMMIPCVEAVAGGKKVEPGQQLDPEKLKTKKVQIHVINGLYNNRMQNQIDNYRPSKVNA